MGFRQTWRRFRTCTTCSHNRSVERDCKSRMACQRSDPSVVVNDISHGFKREPAVSRRSVTCFFFLFNSVGKTRRRPVVDSRVLRVCNFFRDSVHRPTTCFEYTTYSNGELFSFVWISRRIRVRFEHKHKTFSLEDGFQKKKKKRLYIRTELGEFIFFFFFFYVFI